MGAKKLKNETRIDDIKDMFYLTINQISERTTYDRTMINRFITSGELKSEKKNNGKRVVKVSDFVQWWEALNSK